MKFLVFSLLVMCLVFSVEGSKKHNHKDIEFIGFHNVRQMPYNASDMVAVTFPESLFNDDKGPRIYLTGGCSGDQVCDVVNATTDALFCYCPLVNDFASYFSPQESAWTVVAPMLRERYRHMSAKVGKYLYVLGGRYLNDSLVTAVDRLDVLTGVWEFVADWPAATSDGVAWSIEKDNLIMVAGGYDAFYQTPGSLTAFHVLTGQVDAGYPAMAVGRGDTQVATLNGNAFYVIGGWTGDNFVTPSNVVELYDYSANRWQTVAPLHYARGDLACGTMDGSIFAVGGETRPASDVSHTHSVPVKLVERYYPQNDSWALEESIPDNIFRFVGASYNSSTSLYSSAIFLFGGQGTYDDQADYFPVLDSNVQYIPASTVHHSSSDALPPEGIAGIVVAGVVVLAVVVALLIAYCARRHFQYSSLKDDDALPDVAVTGPSAAGSERDKMDFLEAADLREAFPADHSSGLTLTEQAARL